MKLAPASGAVRGHCAAMRMGRPAHGASGSTHSDMGHDIVPLRASEEMGEALRAGGNEVRFMVYTDAGHDCWTETYAETSIFEWFLSQTRATRTSDRW